MLNPLITVGSQTFALWSSMQGAELCVKGRPGIRPVCKSKQDAACKRKESASERANDCKSLSCTCWSQRMRNLHRKHGSIRQSCAQRGSIDRFHQERQGAGRHPSEFRTSPLPKLHGCCSGHSLRLILVFLAILQAYRPFCAAAPTLSSTSLTFRPAQVQAMQCMLGLLAGRKFFPRS